ncbi:hypothetical protein [Streptomyces sp. SID13031]|uniref:hypothetical protein n=1 Tax=Streptomyces sp. SID13031 TaxID=2706046 RepID=UPI0013C764AB|nr:hypothetical protein [Streptomyces sp. SID13031]NEA31728.1 hypothetical protein [Streptomyces sp. SID13031]
MSTVSPIPPTGPGSDPENPDLVDPGTENPDLGTRPGDDSPLTIPEPTPDE